MVILIVVIRDAAIDELNPLSNCTCILGHIEIAPMGGNTVYHFLILALCTSFSTYTIFMNYMLLCFC